MNSDSETAEARIRNMEAKIKITEALLASVRSLGKAAEPEIRIAAAEWEIKISEELQTLQKQTRRRAAMAGKG